MPSMRVWAYSCLGGHSMVCPNRQTKHSYFSPKLLARGGGGGWGRSPKIFPDIPKKFSGHITKFPLPSRHFRESARNFSGRIKIFPKFLSFGRILHCFLPDGKNFWGHVPPPVPPPAHTPMMPSNSMRNQTNL